MDWKNFRPLLVISAWLFVSGCGVYNFTGANLSPDIKTVSVTNFINETGLGPPRLAQNFTEKLRDYLQSNSGLRGVKAEGDLRFEGVITGYTVAPAAPTANEYGLKNRLTIRFKVRFENTKDTTKNFNQEFLNYEDYNQGQNLTSVEEGLIEIIMDRTTFDIFNKALSNW